jgi:hypothetical protein
MRAHSTGPSNRHFDGERWKVRASTILGASHERKNVPCQDAFAAWSDGPRCIAVVADGAGSAPRGGEGAERAAQVIVACLSARPAGSGTREAIRAAMREARTVLSNEATLAGEKLRSFATTVVGGVLQGGHGLFFHLGDGLALAFGGAPPYVLRAASHGTPSEFANISSFLTDADWEQNLVFTPVRSASCAMLMTDGFSPFAVGSDGQPKLRFCEPILDFMERHPGEVGARALADMMNREIVRKTSGDDCTLLWAGRHGGS